MKLFNWIQEYIESKARKRAFYIRDVVSKREKVALEMLSKKREALTSKFCPLYGDICHTNCAHYYKGKIVHMYDSTTSLFPKVPIHFKVISPKCKLWNN